MSNRQTVVAAALGECVHVAGVTNFLRLARNAGWNAIFLGPAVSTSQLLIAAREHKADLVGVSYRLTPETGERLLGEFAEEMSELHEAGTRFVFAGTPPVADRARQFVGFFEAIFDGSESPEDIIAFLKGHGKRIRGERTYSQNAVDRILEKAPYPILRHHFGLPDMDATIAGIEAIADARILDVISLGTDQDAQENFFHPERQDPRRRGAGGVPVRSAEDFAALYQASRRGNFPLLRAYSGTDDFIALAEIFVDSIHTAWCAIPIYWFNQMDGRGPWDLEGSIREHQKVMAWYGERSIPVEVNEPHHWGLRDASDVACVVSAYLSAYNARAFGVRDYIAQLMFNSPPGLSDAMDLAKMLAYLEVIAPLAGEEFRIWRQTRIGLLSHPLDEEAARGHLAAATYLQMSLHPHIVHIVGHTEAHHAATAEDIVVACRVARRAIENALRGAPDMTADPHVQARARELCAEASITLDAIRALADPHVTDPLIDPPTLACAVTGGILDAPQLKSNPYGRGEVITSIDERGACVTIDPSSGRPLTENERLARLGAK